MDNFDAIGYVTVAVLSVGIVWWAIMGYSCGYNMGVKDTQNPYQLTVEYQKAVINYDKAQLDKKLAEVK